MNVIIQDTGKQKTISLPKSYIELLKWTKGNTLMVDLDISKCSMTLKKVE